MNRSIVWTVAALILALGAGTLGVDTGDSARTYLVLGEQGGEIEHVVAAVEGADGTVVRVHPEIGLVVASATDRCFAKDVAGHPSVEFAGADMRSARCSGADSDFGVARIGPMVDADDAAADGDALSSYQWALTAIDAPGAWGLGAAGDGVRVAVLDTGINPNQPDLVANVNQSLCKSFIPDEHWNVMLDPNPYQGPFIHGTHTAGSIAAADNDIGIIGVAPQAEIVAVKVLSHWTGYGTWGQVAEGILYAANIDADVINMSLGGSLNRRGSWDDNGTPEESDDIWLNAKEVAATVNMLKRAVQHARACGAVVVASAGNDAIDGDHDADLIVLPAQLPNVICVSATGPVGFGLDPTVDLDGLASYSNYGQSEIDLAAPGGDFQLYPGPFWGWDMVLSTAPGGYVWMAGTSMAAPHVSGVAALVIGENPNLKPSQVEAILRRSADDLGKRGRDDDYGHGRVNAYEAVK